MLPLPEEMLQRLADLVRRHLGLNYPRERWPDLVRGLEATCRDLKEAGVEACARRLLAAPLERRQVETLGRHLTIGETYFFREEQAFRALADHFLPEFLAARRPSGKLLRFWSAACATGEEAYSLAILLRSRLTGLTGWNLTILATDLNTAFLRRAEEGVYRSWSFRSAGQAFRERWFTRTVEGGYQLHPEIREMVTFAYLNLVEDPYPSLTNNTNAMDVIFCRNVLMYFAEPTRREVMAKLQRSLVDGGILVVGAAESALQPAAGLEPVAMSGLVAYRKQESPPAKVAAPAAPAPRRRPSPSAPPPTLRHTAAAPPELPPKTAERLRELYRRGEFATVCRGGAALPVQDPAYASSVLLVARACANTGSLGEALSWVEKVLASRRTDAEAHYLKAMILDEQGKTQEGLDALRTTLYLDPDYLPAHVALGNILRRLGDRRQAARSFRNALVLLEAFGDDEPVPQAEEMRAGRLREAVIAAIGEPNGR